MAGEDTGIVTIPLSGRIDSNNANKAEEKLRSMLDGKNVGCLVLDAADLEYISSAGLRVLLRLRKDHPELRLINTSPEIYDILDMTGFTEMMSVEKAYRVVSIEGAEPLGQGSNGAVYRIDNDNVVKVYNRPEALEDIRHEREMAKLALVLGIPTAISYDVVKVGGSYGSVFELLNARSFSKILAREPEKFDWCVREFASLLKKIHSTVVPGGKLEDMKHKVLSWAEYVKPHLPEAEGEKLVSLVSAVPENPHMIHGDYHTKNLELQNDEVLLIDMDTLAVGDPIFELGSVFNAFVGFHELNHDGIMAFQGFDFETGGRFFRASLAEYLGTHCPSKLREVEDKARIVGYTRLIRRSIRRGGLDNAKDRAEIEHWTGELVELIRSVDRLTFSTGDITVPAERSSLPEVLEFLEERSSSLEPSVKAKMQLDLAVEEIFVNIADYAYTPEKGSATVSVCADSGSMTVSVTFADRGIPYDPLAKEDPDITLGIGERKPGGLGIFMTKKLTDRIDYEYRDGKNILTIQKKVDI